MNRKDTEQREITIHWWNMGRKTLDHKGSYKDFLLKKGIKVSEIKHPYSKNEGLRFKMNWYAASAQVDTYDADFIEAYNKAIIVFLTLMGDKTLFNDGYGREYKIN